MPAPQKPAYKSSPVTKPCVCCRERDHDGIPDRELDGYVCRECAVLLRVAVVEMEAKGIRTCVRHPHEP